MRSGGVQRHILHRRRAVTSLTQNLDLITGSQGIQAVFFLLLLYLNYSCREFRGPAEEAEHHLNF